MVRLLFTRKNNFWSWLIRFRTWSNYSHVDIVIGQTVVGARAFKGVIALPLSEVLNQASEAIYVDYPCDQFKATNFAFGELGKGYDWLAVIGINFSISMQSKSKWFCSELANEILNVSGLKPFDKKYKSRITPQDLLMLNYTKSKAK